MSDKPGNLAFTIQFNKENQSKMENLKIELKWGAILAAFTFLVFFLSKTLGWQTPETLSKHLTIAFAAFLIGNISCLWLGLKEKKKLSGDQLTFGQGMKSAAIITVFASVIGSLLLFIFASFVNPDFINALTQFSIAEGVLAEGESMTISKFLMEFFTHSIILGLVFSLIISFFSKKRSKT